PGAPGVSVRRPGGPPHRVGGRIQMQPPAPPLAVAFLLLFPLAVPAPPPARAATLTVTDCGDSGAAGQLRQVIAAAASGDTITVPTCTITLTTPASPLTINKNLTISGGGPPQTIIDGGGITGIFVVVSTVA